MAGLVVCFNPRARAGRDGHTPTGQIPTGQFQSTRPRGARRGGGPGAREAYLVSIHAPARGATYNPLSNPLSSSVSIHAPARGATLS